MKLIWSIIGIITSLPIVVIGLFFYFGFNQEFYSAILGVVISLIVTIILRLLIKTKRPVVKGYKKNIFEKLTSNQMRKVKELFSKISDRTFSSNHVARIGVISAILYLFNYSFDFILTALLVMIIVAVSRLALKKHRFIDVIVGAIVGFLSGYAGYYIISRIIF